MNSSNVKTSLAEDKNIIKPSLLRNKLSNQRQEVSYHPNKENHVNISETNEPQFRILANKFNLKKIVKVSRNPRTSAKVLRIARNVENL